MTTTKEDQMRAEFEALLPTTIYMDEHAYGMRRHKSNGTYIDASVQILWDGYKACAEPYEKKLAERDAEIATAEARAASWRCPQCPDKKLQEQLSEANARNAMLHTRLESVLVTWDNCDETEIVNELNSLLENTENENKATGAPSGLNVGLDLLPCPFCGGDPTVNYLELNGLAVIACENKAGCGIQPRTYEQGLRYELAKINWNQRANIPAKGIETA